MGHAVWSLIHTLKYILKSWVLEWDPRNHPTLSSDWCQFPGLQDSVTHPLQPSSRASLIWRRMFLALRKDVRLLMSYTTTKPSAHSTGSSRIHLLSPLWHSKVTQSGSTRSNTSVLKCPTWLGWKQNQIEPHPLQRSGNNVESCENCI